MRVSQAAALGARLPRLRPFWWPSQTRLGSGSGAAPFLSLCFSSGISGKGEALTGLLRAPCAPAISQLRSGLRLCVAPCTPADAPRGSPVQMGKADGL